MSRQKRAVRLLEILESALVPVSRERRAAAQMVWEGLPPVCHDPAQALGKQNAGCAAVFNLMERCNLGCEACYLSAEGSHTPPAPRKEIQRQLRAIRRHLGPWGNTQITGGEVTLLPVWHLGEVIQQALALQLDPMLMTNGEVFRQDEEYLRTLVLRYGLRKIAVHMDTTQRGRSGWSSLEHAARLEQGTEKALQPLRDEVAELVRRTRRHTRRPLIAAHTVTVTDRNLDGVGDIMDWMTSNCDAFRLVSFQPAAPVGRTRGIVYTQHPEEIWRRIDRALRPYLPSGERLNPHAFMFGHPACTQTSLLFVVDFGDRRRVVQINRPHAAEDRRLMERLLRGPFGGFKIEAPLPALRLASLAARHPVALAWVLTDCARRGVQERRLAWDLLRAVARGEPVSLRPLVVVVHRFMTPKQLETREGQERLQSCAFKLPAGTEKGPFGEMVPMCWVNGTDLRTRHNLRLQKESL